MVESRLIKNRLNGISHPNFFAEQNNGWTIIKKSWCSIPVYSYCESLETTVKEPFVFVWFVTLLRSGCTAAPPQALNNMFMNMFVALEANKKLRLIFQLD